MQEPIDVPSTVVLVEGQIVIEGPDGVAVTMTPQAAMETARRIEDVIRQIDRPERP